MIRHFTGGCPNCGRAVLYVTTEAAPEACLCAPCGAPIVFDVDPPTRDAQEEAHVTHCATLGFRPQYPDSDRPFDSSWPNERRHHLAFLRHQIDRGLVNEGAR